LAGERVESSVSAPEFDEMPTTSEEVDAEMAEGFSKIGEVIPSVFYDLIARIMPGTTVVVTVSYLNRQTFHPDVDRIERIALIIGAGYVVGLLLSAISTGLLWLLTRHGKLRPYADESFWAKIKKYQGDRELSALLAKMVAESTCCENLVIAVPLIAIFDPNRSMRCGYYWLAVATALYVAYVRREILRRRLEQQD
jgi:hypothetical protein